jgi:hypothetical protein
VAITLGAFALPDGLVWSDEFRWQPIAQVVSDALDGATIVEESPQRAWRPITLEGGRANQISWAWMARSAVLSLQAALNAPDAQFTLTLHDGRTFTVIPSRQGDAAPIDTYALPVVAEKGPALPSADHWYVVNFIRLLALV